MANSCIQNLRILQFFIHELILYAHVCRISNIEVGGTADIFNIGM